MTDPSPTDNTRVPLTRRTRKNLRDLKRGGETYNDLIGHMIEQYDPDAVDRSRGADDSENSTE